jgi:hypothetical protein
MFLELLSLVLFTVFEPVLIDSNESTLKDILCFKNTGAGSTLLLVQDCVIVAAEGEDVSGEQLLILIAWVIIILYTYNGYIWQALVFALIYRFRAQTVL